MAKIDHRSPLAPARFPDLPPVAGARFATLAAGIRCGTLTIRLPDGRAFRVAGIPVYGVDGAWFISPTDLRAHGQDERIPVKSLADNVDHWVLMLRKLAGPSGR